MISRGVTTPYIPVDTRQPAHDNIYDCLEGELFGICAYTGFAATWRDTVIVLVRPRTSAMEQHGAMHADGAIDALESRVPNDVQSGRLTARVAPGGVDSEDVVDSEETPLLGQSWNGCQNSDGEDPAGSDDSDSMEWEGMIDDFSGLPWYKRPSVGPPYLT